MNKALYKKYADLEFAKDAIEEQQKELKGKILAELKTLQDGKNGVEILEGSFTLQQKITYKFSKGVIILEKELKDKKAEEIAKGAKPDKITEYVVFRPAKMGGEIS